eukprot:COSAG05_NODE_2997_length_2424_cov_1.066667_3_plen_209_part_01
MFWCLERGGLRRHVQPRLRRKGKPMLSAGALCQNPPLRTMIDRYRYGMPTSKNKVQHTRLRGSRTTTPSSAPITRSAAHGSAVVPNRLLSRSNGSSSRRRRASLCCRRCSSSSRRKRSRHGSHPPSPIGRRRRPHYRSQCLGKALMGKRRRRQDSAMNFGTLLLFSFSAHYRGRSVAARVHLLLARGGRAVAADQMARATERSMKLHEG